MFQLIAKLFQIATSRQAQAVAVGGAIVDIVNLDWLRQEAFKLAPGSDREALEEAARTVLRMLNLNGEEVLWPRRRDGSPIAPNYMVLDLGRGRAWFMSKYTSRKSVRGGARRGYGRGFRGGQRSIATISQAQGR